MTNRWIYRYFLSSITTMRAFNFYPHSIPLSSFYLINTHLLKLSVYYPTMRLISTSSWACSWHRSTATFIASYSSPTICAHILNSSSFLLRQSSHFPFFLKIIFKSVCGYQLSLRIFF